MNMSGDIMCPPTALYAITATGPAAYFSAMAFALLELPGSMYRVSSGRFARRTAASAACRTKRVCYMVPSTLLDSSFGGIPLVPIFRI